jgi:hypothetical protein
VKERERERKRERWRDEEIIQLYNQTHWPGDGKRKTLFFLSLFLFSVVNRYMSYILILASLILRFYCMLSQDLLPVSGRRCQKK